VSGASSADPSGVGSTGVGPSAIEHGAVEHTALGFASAEHGGPDDVDLVQLLTPEGVRVDHPTYAFGGGDADIQGFYRDMVLTRRIDAEATALQRQGELGIWASCLGQEAAQVGSGRALGSQDVVFPTYREHGVAWCLGVDPLSLLGLFRGVDLGNWDPAATRFQLYTIVIGAQTLHAVGYAMGLERDGLVGTGDESRDAAVVGYFGDGAISQGDVSEAMVFASSYNAPIVFLCQNNQWAISEPIERQSRIPLYQRARGFGFPGVRVDGNDVLAVHAVTTEALERARSGSGPTLIEAYTYRMGAHTTSDDPTKYRLADELEHWRLKDPIERVRAYLSRTGGADADFFAAVDDESAELARRLRAGCLAMPDPSMLDQFDSVYVDKPAHLAEQQAAYAEYLGTFEDAPESVGATR
jgi:2-oxoisovalerate dehydrogenase E1 component alpha subunit